MTTAALVPSDLLAMMARGVSVNVASRDRAFRPSLMRAVGSSVAADGRSITVHVSRRQSRQLVQDVAATGFIAAVFSEPATHRTVQVKASRATLRNADASDQPVLSAYLASMEHEIQRVATRRPSRAPCCRIGSTISWRSASSAETRAVRPGATIAACPPIPSKRSHPTWCSTPSPPWACTATAVCSR